MNNSAISRLWENTINIFVGILGEDLGNFLYTVQATCVLIVVTLETWFPWLEFDMIPWYEWYKKFVEWNG